VTEAANLGSLLSGDAAETCAGFRSGLLRCAARVVASAGDSDLVFVGRSPESLHDLLSGLLRDTSWQGRLSHLQFSGGFDESLPAFLRRCPESLAAYRAYLDALGLSPEKLVVRPRPVALVDLVCGGHTLHRLLSLLRDWAEEEKADWPAIQRKLRVVAVVDGAGHRPVPKWKRRGKPWSWRDNAPWVGDLLLRGALREVAISDGLWSFLANDQDKVTRGYPPEHWGDPGYASPYRGDEEHLRALRLAHSLYEEGRTRERREEFAALLSAQREIQCDWLRRLVRDIRGGTEERVLSS